MAFNLQQNTGFPSATSNTTTFGGFGTPSTANRGFGQPSVGFGTTTTTGTAFGSTQPTTGFGAPSNPFGGTGTSAFGSTTNTGFGAPPTSNTFSFGSTIGSSSTSGGTLFGGTSTTGTTFGTTQPSMFGGFGSTSSFGTQNTTGGVFGGTGLPGSTSNTGFGGFSFTGSKPAGTLTSSFGANFGGLGTSTGFGPSQPQQQNQFGLGTQPQQLPITEDVAVKNVSIFGDERDITITCWNMLQARWGSGKGQFSQSMYPIIFNQQSKFCRFKAVGYSLLPTGKDEDGVVAISINKKESEVKEQQQQLQSSLSQALLTGHPQYTLVVQGVRVTTDTGCQVMLLVTERSATGQTRRISATELATFLAQAQSRGQLNPFGIENVVPVTAPTQEWIREYLATPPAGIDDRIWKQALQDNPDPERFIPVPMVGFAELRARVRSQEAESSRQLVYLAQAEQKVGELRRAVGEAEVKLSQRRQALMSLQQRLLRLLVKLQVARRAGAALLPVEEELRTRLEHIQMQLSCPSHYKGQLGELLAQMRLQNTGTKASSIAGQYTIEDNSAHELHKLLALEQQGISHLIDVATQDSNALKLVIQSVAQIQGTKDNVRAPGASKYQSQSFSSIM